MKKIEDREQTPHEKAVEESAFCSDTQKLNQILEDPSEADEDEWHFWPFARSKKWLEWEKNWQEDFKDICREHGFKIGDDKK